MRSAKKREIQPDRAPDWLSRHADGATAPDYLPARMLNEYVYCPRLFFLEWVEGLFRDNHETVEGTLRHRKLDAKEDPLPNDTEHDEKPRTARSVQLTSERHRIIARMDLVEAHGRYATPVDYKRGRPRETESGPEPWPTDAVQVAAQAIVLRDNGFQTEEAVLYYDRTRQRVTVPITQELLRDATAAIEEARRLAERGRIPPPLQDSPKCPRCSGGHLPAR